MSPASISLPTFFFHHFHHQQQHNLFHKQRILALNEMRPRQSSFIDFLIEVKSKGPAAVL